MPVPAGPLPQPTVTRPSTGTITRPDLGIVSQPSSGTVGRPVSGTAPTTGEGHVT